MSLRPHLGFLAGSVLTGLVVAALLAWWQPDWVRRPAAAATPNVPNTPDVPADPLSAQTVAADTDAPALAAPAATPTPVEDVANVGSGPASYADAVRRSAPAVVNIFAQRTVTERLPGIDIEQWMNGVIRPRYRERVQRGLGSGVIVDSAGHIVTNHHVIADSDQISVQLADGREAPVTVVGRDPDTDLALLKVSLPRLPVMKLGRSDRAAVGDVVLAIGNPLGLTQTVTHGIISATGRAQLGVATFENFIQTDAAINVGNSGGALVNVRGELIGINTAVLGKNLGAEGIGVAIPVDLVRGVMRELIEQGRVIRGWIGILPEDIAAAQVSALGLPHAGVVIANLYIGSPALQVGLARGDMIEAIDGQAVNNAQELLTQIARRRPNSSIRLSGTRGTEKFTVNVPIVEAPDLSRARR